MRRIMMMLIALLLPIGAAAQGRILPCPEKTIPEQYKKYPRWTADRVAVYPVIPELSGDDLFAVNPYVKGPTGNEPKELYANLFRGHVRLKKLTALQVFTPPGTSEEKALPEPPADFWAELDKATLPENLETVAYPCGTLINALTWAEEDKIEDGQVLPQVKVGDPHVVAWYEEGIKAPDGKPGFRVIQSKTPITLTSGPNKGNLFRFKLIQRCGNPDFDIFFPPQTTEAVAPMPDTPLVKQAEKKVDEAINKQEPEAKAALVAPATPRKSWNPCRGKKSLICGALGVAALGIALRGGETAPPTAAPFVPPPGQLKGDNGTNTPGNR